jgi:hypothetical protein
MGSLALQLTGLPPEASPQELSLVALVWLLRRTGNYKDELLSVHKIS